MSKARSPREVCSTTIGYQWAHCSRSVSLARTESSQERRETCGAPGRPSLATGSVRSGGVRDRQEPGVQSFLGASCALLLRRPELVARLRPARRGSALACSTIRSTALRMAMSSRSASSPPCARAFLSERRSALSLGAGLARLGRRLAQRVEHLVVGDLDALGLDHRGQHGLAAQRPLGVGLGLGDQLLLGLARELEVLRRGRGPAAARRRDVRCHISCALACTRSWGTSIVAAAGRGVDRGLAELALDRGSSCAARELRADLLAQLVERVVAAGLDGEVVVELGQALLLDLLDLDVERRPPCPARCSAW